MLFKKTVLVCILLLAILAVGAVSASDDAAANELNESLSLEDSIDEPVITGENEKSLKYITIEEEYDISQDNSSFCNVSDDEGLNGTVTVQFDNDTVYNQTFNGKDKNISFNSNSITGFKLGKVNVTVTYNKNSLQSPVTLTKIVDFTYLFSFTRSDESVICYGDKVKFTAVLPSDAKNKVKVEIAGKTYWITPRKGTGSIYIPTGDLKLEEYTVYASYFDSKYPINKVNATFTISPKVIYPSEMSVGEKETITVITGKQSGNVFVYDKGSLIAQEKIVNGLVDIPLDRLAKGNHELYLEYTSGDYKSNQTFNISVIPNTPGIEAGISASEITAGNFIVVNFKGPVSKERVYVYVDGKEYISEILSSGSMSEDIIGLTPGSHKIKVAFKDGDKFYSNTFFVNVKPAPIIKKQDVIKLTLKKVKIKRSAKKLVLSATLKINKKAVKGKKLTFKFNGKKYTAKTNKKGIAKVTIKKKVLKKLKVGKKVKYQVSYGKVTVKRTAKVKR